MFEPLAMSVTYARTRKLARSQVLAFSKGLVDTLDWLLIGHLRYNHSVGALAPARFYRRRVVKDLRLGFALPELAAAFSGVAVRHPLDAICSHLKMDIRRDQRTLARRNVRRLLRQEVVLTKYPWLASLDISYDDASELELVEWCIENASLASCVLPSNLIVVRYEDIVNAQQIPLPVWDLLRRSGIDGDRARIDLSRPSKNAKSYELEALRSGEMTMKYRVFFNEQQISRAREILAAAGLMQDNDSTVFGHKIV